MAVMMAVGGLIAVGMLLFIPTLISINTRYEIATAQVERFRASGAVVSPGEVTNLQARTTVLTDKFAAPQESGVVDHVARIRSAAVSGITFSGFALQSGVEVPTMQVTGTAVSRETVQRFVEALRATNGIVSVDSPLSNLVKSTNVSFAITVTFAK